ncbi:MAG: discoidin domain-containing protein [Planctomycetes bacterium]|nr:discoidin domain-containing protein [Planctomycetota bacterium]
MGQPVILVAAVLLAAIPARGGPESRRTDWFRKAGYGVFVHYLSGLQNDRESIHSLGRQTPWDECVREFDTERFAETMREVGAGYVIFTVMQIQRFMIAPNATFDRISGYRPGEACSTRDLVEDLHRSLARRKIPLMLYWTGDGPRGDPKAGPAFGCKTPVTREFVRAWADVVREYGQRYGEKVAGWWVDGCYPFIGYDEEKLGILAEALRAGHPGRIIALNPGVEARVSAYTRHEDYTCGEQNRFFDMPVERFIQGEQWHILSYLGSGWAQPGAQYGKRELAEYVFDVNRRGGVVSIDVLLYRDGSLDRSQVEILKAVRHELDTATERPPVPPGNLAYRKPSRLASLDGARELPANGGVHVARHGVDGRPETFAQGANEWPWTYEVDLVDTKRVGRIKITFGPNFATRIEILLSADGGTWRTVASRSDLDGRPIEASFEPVEARHVRIRGIEPDGPGQKGGQMSIAELEVYEK